MLCIRLRENRDAEHPDFFIVLKNLVIRCAIYAPLQVYLERDRAICCIDIDAVALPDSDLTYCHSVSTKQLHYCGYHIDHYC